MTLKPRFRQISKAARISSSSTNEWVWRSQAGPMIPPERLSLMWSTPFLICSRTAFTHHRGRRPPAHDPRSRSVRPWCEEITAGEQPRADMLSGIEGPLPCDVHEMMGAGAAQSDNAGFGERGREPVAEQDHLIGERHLVEG